MAAGWANPFRRLLADIAGRAMPSHGYPLAAIKTAEARLGVRLPEPLRDYYLSIGRHKLNRAQNRLLPPDGLNVVGGRLVFMEENQWVVYWGVRSRTPAADPVVFQTTDPDDGDWAALAPCSQFLSAMLCWQAVCGGLPHTGYSDSIDLSQARRIRKGWPLVGRVRDLSAFARSGQVVCLLREGKSALVHVGARSRQGFKTLVSELGIGVHDA